MCIDVVCAGFFWGFFASFAVDLSIWTPVNQALLSSPGPCIPFCVSTEYQPCFHLYDL